MTFRNKYYAVLKSLVNVLIGFAASYYILSFFIDAPNVKNTIGVVIVISWIINLFLITMGREYDGQIIISSKPDGKKLFSLEINKDPEELEASSAVLFRVTDKGTTPYEDLD
jgi:hypothetical protein